MSSAWPHFVPRLELDVELKKLTQRLDEVAARVSRQEPLVSSIEVRLEELEERCGGEAKVGLLASQAELASLEMRCGQKISAETLSISVELEELASRLASKDALEGLQMQHDAQLSAMSCDITAIQAGLVQTSTEQEDFASFARENFQCKKEHEENCEAFRGMHRQLEAQLASTGSTLKELREELRALPVLQLQSQLEQQQLLQKVQESSLQTLQADLAVLEHRAWDTFAPKTSLSKVFSMASEAHTKLDFAMMDRATLRQRMEEELDSIKKTLHRQQSTFLAMDAAVESVNRHDQKLLNFNDSLETQRSERKDLSAKVQEQQQRLEEFQMKLREDLRVEEDLRAGLQQHVEEQVSICQATADSLSTCSTRISLEHMEKSLALRRSLDELSTDHWQFKSQILSADQVKATRGEDGQWQIHRSSEVR